jgi:predicted ATPase/class 3 adenylate cyclase
METHTFLFTDLEGSTRLWEAHPEAMRAALVEHDGVLTKAITEHGGRVFKHTGDGMLSVFKSAGDAVAAAADAQIGIVNRPFPDVGTLKVRMAINTGGAEERDGDYFGPALNRASRLLDVAHGGQILVGLVTERLARLGGELRFVDLGERRIRDLARPERVFQLAGPGLPSGFPRLLTLDEIPNNLPTLATSFVGRDQELAEVEKLVRGARLVTVTGVGGAGKTRLALQVAASMSGHYPGGTWLVELASVTDPDLVVSAAARALGVPEQPGRPVLESLIEHLRAKRTMLIIDNCEHLITASARLVDTILTETSDVSIIVTSRELLGIGGEVAYGVRSMLLPMDPKTASASELARYDAIRLFVERAAASQPAFHLSEDTAPAIAEICTRLDGMPLAIELAAARIRSFSPQQIADNLDRRFRLLTGGSRTALPRQQTLAAAIDWSYQLLDPIERKLFERLSVFQGGFTLEAAEQVAVGDGIETFDVLDLIPSLVDKSLVSADTDRQEARYALLETIRQFARDLLDEHGKAEEYRLRHAEFFVELAEAAEPHVRGLDERLWWGRIDADIDNLRQTMLWSIESGHPELALRVSGALWRFWWFTIRYSAGLRWLHAALDAAGEDADRVLAAKAHLGIGTLAGFVALPHDSEEHLTRALELYRQLDAEGAEARDMKGGYSAALINLTAFMQHDPERGIEFNREAVEVAEKYGDLVGYAVAMGNIAEGHASMGDLALAREEFEESIAASERIGSAHRLVEAIFQLGSVELNAGEPERAEQVFRRALAAARGGGLTEYEALARTAITISRHDQGVPDQRREFAQQAAIALENEDFRKNLFFFGLWVVERADMDVSAQRIESAAQLMGGLRSLQDNGFEIDWTHHARRDRVLEQLRETMGDIEFEAAMDRYSTLTIEDLYRLIAASPDD